MGYQCVVVGRGVVLMWFGRGMMVASDQDDGKLPLCQMSLKI
jgi:hypothetical protein